MELTPDTVRGIAALARLKLKPDEVTRYQNELAKILKAFDDLSKVPIPSDLQGDARSAISSNLATGASDQISRLRADVAENSLSTKTFLAGAPDKEGVFVRVPAILDKST